MSIFAHKYHSLSVVTTTKDVKPGSQVKLRFN